VIVQRHVERHRDDEGQHAQHGARDQVAASGLRPSQRGNHSHDRGQQRRPHEEDQEWRVGLCFGIDPAHRGQGLDGLGAVEALHDEGREGVEQSAEGGAGDGRGTGGDDVWARRHGLIEAGRSATIHR